MKRISMLGMVLVLVITTACASKSPRLEGDAADDGERSPAATTDAFKVFVAGVLKSSSQGERGAARELVKIYNEAAVREGSHMIDDLDTLLRESADVQKRALRWFRAERDFGKRLGVDLAKQDFIAGGARGAWEDRIAKVDPKGESRLREVGAQLHEVAKRKASLRPVVEKMMDDLLFVYAKTEQKILNETACSTLKEPDSVRNLAEVVEGIAGDVRQAGGMTSKEINQSLDRHLARVTGEEEAAVRELRVCALIKNCGIFDRSRGAGCVR